MIPNRERTQKVLQCHPDGQDAVGNGDWDRLERWVGSVDRRLSTLTRKRHGTWDAAGRLQKSSPAPGGSDPGNTDPPTLHLGGLDWLDLTVYGRSPSTLKQVVDCLLQARETIRQDKAKEGLACIGPLCGNLKAGGSGKGYNHQPVTWTYKGIKFRFGAKSGQCGPLEEQLLCFVDVTGDPFLALGEVEVFRIIRKVLELLGIIVSRVRVRRIDACVDMADVDVGEFTREVQRGAFVGRSDKVKLHIGRDGKSTGFTVQGFACSLDVYDKIRETEGKESKRAWLMAYRWHGRVPERATRVEFRIRPEKCDWAEFRSLGELLEGLKRIFGWASQAWFRLCEVKDRRHTERAKVVNIWRDVTASFASMFESMDSILLPRVPQPVEVSKLARSALRSLATAVAQCGREIEREEWGAILVQLVVGSIPDAVERAEHEKLIRAEWETKVLTRLADRPNFLRE